MAIPSDSAFAQFREQNRRFDQNRDSWADWPDRYRALCRTAVELGPRAVGELTPCLFGRATDERNLREAWDHCAQRDHAGQDEERCADYEGDEFGYCRWLRDSLRGEEYAPGPTIPRSIRKSSGSGTRVIHVHNLCDRLVQRGLVQVLGPVLDARLDRGCLGYRPRLGRLHALARAEHLLLNGHTAWLAEDLKNAFDSVPQRRLMDILRRMLRPAQGRPEDQQKYAREMNKLFTLLGKMLVNASGIGIPQGGPVSSMMLNVYLNHLLDQPWRRGQPDLPLLRYSDDILICCRSAAESEQARPLLETRVISSGMELKSTTRDEKAVHDLRRGDGVEWLGFEICLGRSGMEVRISPRGRRKMEDKLLLGSVCTDPLRSIAACLREAGPAYPFEDHQSLHEWIEQTADELGLRARLPRESLERAWSSAYQRWLDVRAEVADVIAIDPY
jgi:hypothetical protein